MNDRKQKKNLPCEKHELFALLVSLRHVLFIPLHSLLLSSVSSPSSPGPCPGPGSRRPRRSRGPCRPVVLGHRWQGCGGRLVAVRPPCCSPFPPRKQLPAAVVGGAVVVVVVVLVLILPVLLIVVFTRRLRRCRVLSLSPSHPRRRGVRCAARSGPATLVVPGHPLVVVRFPFACVAVVIIHSKSSPPCEQ